MSDIKNIFENARKKSKNKNTTCPNCNSPIRSNDEYCSVCGYNLTSIDEDESTNDQSDTSFDEESQTSKRETVIERSDNNISDDIDYSKKNDLNKIEVKDSFFDDELEEKKKESTETIRNPKVTKEDLLNLYNDTEKTNNVDIEINKKDISINKTEDETIENKDIISDNNNKEEINIGKEESNSREQEVAFQRETDSVIEDLSGISNNLINDFTFVEESEEIKPVEIDDISKDISEEDMPDGLSENKIDSVVESFSEKNNNLVKDFTFVEESEEIKPIEIDDILQDISEEDKPDGLSNVDEIIKEFADKKNGIEKKEKTNINEDVIKDIDEYVKNIEKKLKEEVVSPTYINSRKPEDIFEEEIYDYYEPKNIEVEEATHNRTVGNETIQINKYNDNETIEAMFEAVDDLIENENILFDFNKKDDDVILLNKDEYIDEVEEEETTFVVDIENILKDIENNQFDNIGEIKEEGPLKNIENFMNSGFSRELEAQGNKVDEIKEKEFSNSVDANKEEKPIENLLIMQEMEKIKSNILETESALKSLLEDKNKPYFDIELEEKKGHLNSLGNEEKSEAEIVDEIISEDEILNKYYDTDEETRIEERKAYIEYLKEIGIVEEKVEEIKVKKDEIFETEEKIELKQPVYIEKKEVKKKKVKKIVMEFKIDKKRLNG